VQVLRNKYWVLGVMRYASRQTALPLPHPRLPVTVDQSFENRIFLEGYRWAMANPEEAKKVKLAP
jgi:hypothetical protein